MSRIAIEWYRIALASYAELATSLLGNGQALGPS